MLQYLAGAGVSCRAWQLDTPTGKSLLGVAILPGGTALVLMGGPGDLQPILRWWLDGPARESPLHYAQSLVETGDDRRAAALKGGGFERMTGLAYLERDARYPWLEETARADLEWVNLDQIGEREFGRVVLETYRDSADCPELTGVRPIGDVLAAHRAAGAFVAAHWEVLHCDGKPAGCLLLARLFHAPVFEVVYVGVIPEFRRRGLGSALLGHAIARTRELGGRAISLVVDERNVTARRLYDRFGFRSMGVRDAYWRRFR